MSENITPFTGFTRHPEPPESLLEKAKLWGMDKCVVIGTNENDELIFGGSFSGEADILFLVMRALWFIQQKDFERVT